MSRKTAEEAEADRLLSAWRDARQRLDRNDSDRNIADEQTTFDAVVDYVEAHGLNFSKYDPRSA